MRSIYSTTLLMLCTSLISFSAFATNDPFSLNDPLASSTEFNTKKTYIGATLHSSSMKGFCNNAAQCDENDMGGKLFAGYRIRNDLYLEGSLLSLGDVQNATGNVRSSIKAISVNGVKVIRLNPALNLFAKGGVTNWKANNSDGKREGVDLTFGAGATYQIKHNLRIRAEWQRLMDIETSLVTSSNVELLSLGVEMDLKW